MFDKLFAPLFKWRHIQNGVLWWKPSDPKVSTIDDFPTARPERTQWSELIWDPAWVQKAFVLANTYGDFTLIDVIRQQLLNEDDRYCGVLQQRTQSLAGLPIYFNQDGKRSDRKTRVERALEEDWWDFCQEDSIEQVHSNGLSVGYALGSYEWFQGSSGRYIPRMRLWDYSDLEWDPMRQLWFAKTRESGKVAIDPYSNQWFLYTPFGAVNPWNNGLWRRMTYWVMAKRQIMRDWVHYSEVCGFPTWIIKAPEGWQAIDRLKAAESFTRLGRDKAVSLPSKVDANIVECKSQAYVGFENLINRANMAIAIGIMSQNLTSEVTQGAKASTSVHEQIANKLLKADAARLSTFLHHHPIKWWTRVNFREDTVVPWPEWDTTPVMDLQHKAEAQRIAIDNAKQMLELDPDFDIVNYLGETFALPISHKAKNSHREKNNSSEDQISVDTTEEEKQDDLVEDEESDTHEEEETITDEGTENDTVLSVSRSVQLAKQLSDFPKKGDNKKVSLRNSQWGVFDPKYAADLKENWPEIWRAGGNIRGNDQYRKLTPVVSRGGSVRNETEENAVRLREAWGARHYGDHRLAGVVAQIKWFVIGELGESGMKAVIQEKKDRIRARQTNKGDS